MPARKVSDEQLRTALASTNSPTEIARQFGLSTRAVITRLRGLGVPPLPDKSYIRSRENQTFAKRPSGRIDTEVENGVVLVASDAHYFPGAVSTAHRAFVHFIKELRPRAVVMNGDVFDGAGISRYPRIGWDKKPSVMDELKAVTARLDEIDAAAGNALKVWPLGNHDARFETYLAASAPQYEGVRGFSLNDHFPLWKSCWALWINGHTVVKHRWKGGIHATRNNTVNAGTSIVTGHLHSLKVAPFSDYNGTRYGVDTGTLADPYGEQFADYTEISPVDWRSGFAVLTFHNGRLLWPELVHVLDEGEVEFRGKVIAV
jgi:hypothetical protein